MLPALLLLAGCAPALPLTSAPGGAEVIGALFDKTGSASQSGASIEVGLALAEADINRYAAAKGAAFRIKLQVEDASVDPLAAYGRLKAAGVKAVVGPQTSAEAAALMGPATADGLVLVSPSSTAPSLAKDDNLIRFAPVDVLQGLALVRAMSERGVKAEIAIARDDVYGKDLAQEVEYAAGLQGITHIGTITYAANGNDYAAAIAQAETLATVAQAKYGASAVGIELVSYSEAAGVMKAARGKPALSSSRWFGCDGNARTPALTDDADAAVFARQVKFMASTLVTPTEAGGSDQLDPAIASVLARPQDFAGLANTRLSRAPGTFAYTAYDALWALALAREELGGLGDAAKVKAALYNRSQSFLGVAGRATLNPQGDRTTGTYGFFSLGDDVGWKLDATYGNQTYTRLD